jgi:hypothetical protein
MIWVKRSRAKWSSGIEVKAVEATVCSKGEAVEGTLHRQQRALDVSKNCQNWILRFGKLDSPLFPALPNLVINKMISGFSSCDIPPLSKDG